MNPDTLRDYKNAQHEFTRCVAHLILYVNNLPGYEVRIGQAWRSPEQAAVYAAQKKGIVNSLHTDYLAVDLDLYINEVYQATTEAWLQIGEWWEIYGKERGFPLCWGGRFKQPDGNHFSWGWGGRR